MADPDSGTGLRIGGGGEGGPITKYTETWIDDPSIVGGGYTVVQDPKYNDGAPRWYHSGVYYSSPSQLPQVPRQSGGSTNPTNVFVTNNPGELNQDIISDGTDGFPAGTVYQRNQLTGGVTVKYRPGNAPASLYNDYNGDGYDDQTGLPLGVTSIGGDLYYQGKRVNPDGSLMTPAQIAADSGGGEKATIGGSLYEKDPTTGKWKLAIQGPPSSSSGGGGGGSTAAARPDLSVQVAATNQAGNLAQQEASDKAQMERLLIQQGFQGTQAELDRAVQLMRLGLDTTTAGLGGAKQLSDVMGSFDPLALPGFLKAGGGNYMNALAGGATGLTDNAMLPAAYTLALNRMLGAGEGGNVAGLPDTAVPYGNDNIASGLFSTSPTAAAGADVPPAALTPEELAAKQAAYDQALQVYNQPVSNPIERSMAVAGRGGNTQTIDPYWPGYMDGGLSFDPSTGTMSALPVSTAYTPGQYIGGGQYAPKTSTGPVVVPLTKDPGTSMFAAASGTHGLPERAMTVVGDPRQKGRPNPEMVRWTPRGNIIQPIKGGMAGMRRLDERMPIRRFADGGFDWAALAAETGGDYGWLTNTSVSDAAPAPAAVAPQPAVSQAQPVATASPSPTVQPPAALPATATPTPPTYDAMAPTPVPVRFDGGPVTGTSGGEINPVGTVAGGLPGVPPPVPKPEVTPATMPGGTPGPVPPPPTTSPPAGAATGPYYGPMGWTWNGLSPQAAWDAGYASQMQAAGWGPMGPPPGTTSAPAATVQPPAALPATATPTQPATVSGTGTAATGGTDQTVAGWPGGPTTIPNPATLPNAATGLPATVATALNEIRDMRQNVQFPWYDPYSLGFGAQPPSQQKTFLQGLQDKFGIPVEDMLAEIAKWALPLRARSSFNLGY